MRPALAVSIVVVALVVAYANAQCNAGNVAANAVLYHGTTIAAFARNWYSGKGAVPAGAYDTLYDSHPSGPAWFANTIGFAWHAGVRSMPAGGGKGYLNKYYAMVKIPVLDCATHADFYGKAPATNGYLQVNGYAGGPPAKDMAGALGFCANKAAHKFAGYIIQSDRVRGQPETILCEPDVWLNRFRRNQNGQDVVQVTVHGQGAVGNNHPKAGANAKARTLTWTHNGVNMRLWWPMTGFPALGDLVDTATGNQILLETKGKVSRAQRARGAAAAAAKGPGPFAPNPLKNPDVKPEQEKIDYQVEVQVLDSARSAENNGAHPHWDDDDVPAPKFAQRRMRGRVSVSRVLQSME